MEELLRVNLNVFSFHDDEGRSKYPFYISPKAHPLTIDLLYWKGHYATIKTFSRFAADTNKHMHKLLWCKRCMTHFNLPKHLENHMRFCEGPDFCKPFYTLPPYGKKVKFQNTRYQLRLPFAIYADFEAINTKPDADDLKKGRYQKQIPCSVGYKLISTFNELQKPFKKRTGADCVQWFINKIKKLSKNCLEFLFDEKRLIMTEEDDVKHEAASECYICSRPFDEQKTKLRKVRDHDHYTGKYRGAAHSMCNLALRRTYKIPVFFHNFRGYDAHLISQAMGDFKGDKISVIGQGMEKYLSLSLGKHIIFKDSLMFLNSSLERLGKNLLAGGKVQFRHLLKECDNYSAAQIDLLLRKGVYPYDYMNDWARFKETQLPPKTSFYNKLHGADCSDEDYAHAQLVWKEFECKTIEDYHDIYLKSKMIRLTNLVPLLAFQITHQAVKGLVNFIAV